MLAAVVDNRWISIENVTTSEEDILFREFSVSRKNVYIDPETSNWDGVYRKYNRAKRRLARPLLSMLKRICKAQDLPLQLEDRRGPWKYTPIPESEINADFLPGITLEQYQIDAIRKSTKIECGIFNVPTGGGKCLGRDTPVMMYDGTIKKVQDVVVGDLLMGDDSTPRTVFGVCSGIDELYRVDQKYGDSYVVNSSHILSLIRTPDGKSPSKDYQKVDLNIGQYMASSRTQKHLLKGYKTPVSYAVKNDPLCDPYLLGLWLGDGIAKDLQFCLNDQTDGPVLQYLTEYCHDNGYVLVPYEQETDSTIYAIRLYEGIIRPDSMGDGVLSNPLKQVFRRYGLLGNKHIPDDFKRGSETTRLQCLAGLVDSDGYTNERNDTLYFTLSKTQLVDDIIVMARSLGFRVTSSPTVKTDGTGSGFAGEYIRITISGFVHNVPSKTLHKKCVQRRIKKNPLVCGINVVPIGIGQYYGFSIDGNRRFLLGDFTVTHNTELIAGICKAIECPTVILANQTVVIDQIKERLELRCVGEEIGLFYAGKRPNGQMIVVGSIQSLMAPTKKPMMPERTEKDTDRTYAKKLDNWVIKKKAFKTRTKNAKILQEYVKKAEMLIVDECDTATSQPFKNVFRNQFRGRRRYGFSGTPFDEEKPVEAVEMQEHLGSIIFKESRDTLLSLGRIIPSECFMLAYGTEGRKDDASAFDIAYNEWLVENVKFHNLITKLCVKCTQDPEHGTLILVDRETLGHALREAIVQAGISCEFIFGKTPKKQRAKMLAAFESRELKVLIGGKIINRGLDLKNGCENMIIATGGKLSSELLQKVGRALRRNKRGFSKTYLFYYMCNKYLYDHSRRTLKTLIIEGFKTNVVFPKGVVSGEQLIASRFRVSKKLL